MTVLLAIKLFYWLKSNHEESASRSSVSFTYSPSGRLEEEELSEG